MTLFIDSRFNVGQKVMNGKYREGKVVDIELKKSGPHCHIMCLVEFETRERAWCNEYDLTEAEE